MPLLPPFVVGPLSECSRWVRVQGQLTGARVKVHSGGRLVAEGIASWSDHHFSLFATESLQAGEAVTAIQEDSSGPGFTTPEPYVRVLKKTPPGPLSLLEPPYVCGQAVWIQGAVPGAKVTLKEGTKILGSDGAPDGDARLVLSSPITGGMLLADQEACGLKSGDTPFPPALVPPESLPAPVVEGPLRACERRIRVSGVLVGALVIVERSGGTSLASTFDYPDLDFYNVPPLKLGEVVTARQEFPACQRRSPRSEPVTVGSHTPVPVPTLLGPVCAPALAVHLGGLIPGCRVRIRIEGFGELGMAEAPAEAFTVPLPAIPAGSVLTAQQELCGVWSAQSNKVTVSGADPFAPFITAPIYACGGTVHVSAPAGTWVILQSLFLGGFGEVGRAFVVDPSGGVDVRVAPLLLAGDTIKPLSFGCGPGGGFEVQVKPAPERLAAPGIGRAMQGMTRVTVTGVIPGARVDVFVNGAWRGGAPCSRSSGEVPIGGLLNLGDQVAARQMLCTRTSPLTTPPVIVVQAPVAAFTMSTAFGEAPLEVKFTNKSTGMITSHAWDLDGNGSVDSNVTHPSKTYTAVGSFTVKLTVEGPGGTSSTTATVQVTPFTRGFDQIVVFNEHIEQRSVYVWTRDLSGGAWVAHGELMHHDPPKTVTLADAKSYEVACVDLKNGNCPGINDPANGDCRRYYTVIRGKKGGGTIGLTAV